MNRLALDLTKYTFRREYGGIVAWGTWWWNREEDTWRPALVLTRTRESGFGDIAPYVIPLENAFLWTDLPGIGSPAAAAAGSHAAAEHLGLNAHSKIQCMKIASIVMDLIGELLLIPPRPPADQRVAADALLTSADGRQVHREVLDDV